MFTKWFRINSSTASTLYLYSSRHSIRHLQHTPAVSGSHTGSDTLSLSRGPDWSRGPTGWFLVLSRTCEALSSLG